MRRNACPWTHDSRQYLFLRPHPIFLEYASVYAVMYNRNISNSDVSSVIIGAIRFCDWFFGTFYINRLCLFQILICRNLNIKRLCIEDITSDDPSSLKKVKRVTAIINFLQILNIDKLSDYSD